MNYSDNPGHVRVDYFKPDWGKWYMTEVIDMTPFWNETYEDKLNLPHQAVRKAIIASSDVKARIDSGKEKPGERGRRLLNQFIAVVVDPYHKLAYPICLLPGKSED
jgi:hypothetical protein